MIPTFAPILNRSIAIFWEVWPGAADSEVSRYVIGKVKERMPVVVAGENPKTKLGFRKLYGPRQCFEGIPELAGFV